MGGREALLKLAIAPSSEREGGLGMPNFKMYYKACILTRVIDWMRNEEGKDWVQLEKDLMGTPFQSMLWAPLQVPQATSETSPFD